MPWGSLYTLYFSTSLPVLSILWKVEAQPSVHMGGVMRTGGALVGISSVYLRRSVVPAGSDQHWNECGPSFGLLVEVLLEFLAQAFFYLGVLS